MTGENSLPLEELERIEREQEEWAKNGGLERLRKKQILKTKEMEK